MAVSIDFLLTLTIPIPYLWQPSDYGCFRDMHTMYTLATIAMTISAVRLALKKPCQYAPTAAPNASRASLNMPICHQENVYDLNGFKVPPSETRVALYYLIVLCHTSRSTHHRYHQLQVHPSVIHASFSRLA